MSQLLFKKQLKYCHVPKAVSYVMVCITTVTLASFAPYLKNLKILKISNYDTFCYWHFLILTLSNFDPFYFWHFPILTLSNFDPFQFLPNSETVGFWHFPIPTLSTYPFNPHRPFQAVRLLCCTPTRRELANLFTIYYPCNNFRPPEKIIDKKRN